MNIRTLYLSHRLASIAFEEDSEHPLIGEIQQLLLHKNLYQGPIHHKYDTETIRGITLFQEKENLPVTGIVDPLTYCRLHQANTTTVTPLLTVTKRADFTLSRANILITTSSRQLTLFNGNTPLHQYPVGIGKIATPTPLGNYAIALKVMNPGGVLGSRWLGLNYDSYGIHGTNRP